MIYIFIPNESIGDFFLGDNISKYNLPFRIEQKTNQWDQYDSYELSQEGISLWVEDSIIKCIRCEKECIWKNDNTIGMKYKDFITQYSVIPDTSEKIYLKSGNVGQYQMVYDFDDIGLQIWVWKGKIRTVIISNYHDLA